MRILSDVELGAVAGQGYLMDLSYQSNDHDFGGSSSVFGAMNWSIGIAIAAGVAAIAVAVIQSCTNEKTTTTTTTRECDKQNDCTEKTIKEVVIKEKG